MNPNGDASSGVPGGTAEQPQAGKIASESQAEPTPPNESPKDLEDLKKVAGENAQLRKRLKEAEARLKQVDDAEQAAQDAALTENQKLAKQVQDAQTIIARKDAIIASQAVQLEAAAAHFANPAHVAKLIGDKLEYGEDGAPTNVKQLLDDLAKSDPYLKATETPPQPARAALSATNAGRGSSNSGALTHEMIGKMSPDEYNAQRTEIMQFLAKNMARR